VAGSQEGAGGREPQQSGRVAGELRRAGDREPQKGAGGRGARGRGRGARAGGRAARRGGCRGARGGRVQGSQKGQVAGEPEGAGAAGAGWKIAQRVLLNMHSQIGDPGSRMGWAGAPAESPPPRDSVGRQHGYLSLSAWTRRTWPSRQAGPATHQHPTLGNGSPQPPRDSDFNIETKKQHQKINPCRNSALPPCF